MTSRVFLFPEPGCIPGVPGTFSGQKVEMDDDGTLHILPLDRHPHFDPAGMPEMLPQTQETEQAEEN